MKSDWPAILVDTNVLLYGYDATEPMKQQRALEVLTRIRAAGAGALTVQVLGEFFNISTKKLAPPLKADVAAQVVTDYLDSWTVYDLGRDTVRRAVQAAPLYRLSYWDALIWAAAKEHDMRVILTEDLQDGQSLDGVLVRNPFADGFDLESVL
jgi:predicted nucleic acid-binding protein